jgi:hypothetical protein
MQCFRNLKVNGKNLLRTVSADDQEVEETDDSPEETEETPNEETPNPNDDDADKRNRAFADLRRQADENKKYAEFISRLAKDSGTTPDEILSRYQERQVEEQAEAQGVPVEHLQKLNDTETRLSQLEEQLFAERLNNQVEGVLSKYGNDEDAVRSTFEYMAQSGIDPRVQQVDFEKLYRAANLDNIIQKEVEKSRQQDLSDKKKRQESASIGNGTSVSPSKGDLSDEDVDAILAKFDIKI